MALVLVIDDDRSFRDIVRLFLEGDGHEVVEAADGGEGITTALRQPVDLILIDLYMPGKDGLETIRELRRWCPDVPVIAMTGGWIGCETAVILKTAGALGAADTLVKPFGPAALSAAVRAALAGSAAGAQ